MIAYMTSAEFAEARQVAQAGYKGGGTALSGYLSANPDVAGVFSCNDPMAVGAAQAVADAMEGEGDPHRIVLLDPALFQLLPEVSGLRVPCTSASTVRRKSC